MHNPGSTISTKSHIIAHVEGAILKTWGELLATGDDFSLDDRPTASPGFPQGKWYKWKFTPPLDTIMIDASLWIMVSKLWPIAAIILTTRIKHH